MRVLCVVIVIMLLAAGVCLLVAGALPLAGVEPKPHILDLLVANWSLLTLSVLVFLPGAVACFYHAYRQALHIRRGSITRMGSSGATLVVMACVLIAYAVVNANTPIGMRAAAPHFRMGNTGPNVDLSWTVRRLDGTRYEMSEFRGAPIILNFWAPWCMPCISEYPSLEVLWGVARDSGVELACISLDTLSATNKLVSAAQWRLPVYVSSGESLPLSLVVTRLPTTLFISSAGECVVRKEGAHAWDDAECARLVKLLGDS